MTVAVIGLGLLAVRTAQELDGASALIGALQPIGMDDALAIDDLAARLTTGHDLVAYTPILIAAIAVATIAIPVFLRLLLLTIGRYEVQAQRLRASEGKLREITSHAIDAIVMIDGRARIQFWNPAAETLFGYTAAQAIGRNVHDLLTPEALRADAEAGFAKFTETGEGPIFDARREVLARRADGSEFRAELSIGRVEQDGEHWAVGVIRDVTAQHLAAEHLRELATIDALTGLRNRQAVMDAAREETARAVRYERPMTVLAIDLDHFKVINDTHGHAAGDEVLRSFAHAMVTALRSHDVMGRIGGEEFIVILPETTAQEAELLAMRLRRKINSIDVPYAGKTLNIHASIGISDIGPHDGLDPLGAVLKRADEALYAAKAAGRDRFVTLAAPDAPVTSGEPVPRPTEARLEPAELSSKTA